jgi:antitoxin component YwqK of YwqJK toxin-antitoxin module
MSSEYCSSDYSHWDEEGLREGEFKRWYGNGRIREQRFYRNGKLEGAYKSWYENGQISAHGFYKNGKWEGERRVWHYNGNLMMQMFCRNDDAEGKVKCWSEEGCLLEREFYRNSIRINFLNQNEQQGFSQIKRMFRKNMIRLLDTILISDLAKLCS